METKQTKLDKDFFEIVIIYNLLTDEQYIGTVVDSLDPKYFKNKNISAIINIIVEFFNTRRQAPTLTEIKALIDTDDLRQGFKDVVSLFADIDKKFNRDELYANTEKFIKENAIFHTMLEVADECQLKRIESGSILNKFEKACSISLNNDLGLEFYSQIDKHITDLQTQETYLPSTWPWLDKKLGGGFIESGRALYLFAGATNVGKSIFLGNIAVNISQQGKTVILISLEMSELMYAKRISSCVSKIPISELKSSPSTVKDKVVSYKKAHPKSKLVIKEFPPNTMTVAQITGYIKKLMNKGINPDAIVLDYINLLHSTIGNNSYERIKYISEQLRAVSYHFECPVITATQINRAGITEKNPGVETISESIGLAATADCIMSIWQEEGDVDLSIIRLGIIKNRYGQKFGSCAMSIDYSTLTLKESQAAINTEESVSFDKAFSNLQDE